MGIVGITRVAAKEYASKGVRVNAIAPGSIATPLFQEVINSTPNSKEDYQKQVPMNRIAESDEVASVVTFLCSDAASYITGDGITG
jgi:NAD(P)-dependent dehydrogenase (short-subunit alcohol dehydrogenase family)